MVKNKIKIEAFLKSFYGFLYILFIQYNNVICRPLNHTVGRTRAEIRTRAGRPAAGTLLLLDHHPSYI